MHNLTDPKPPPASLTLRPSVDCALYRTRPGRLARSGEGLNDADQHHIDEAIYSLALDKYQHRHLDELSGEQ